MSNQHTCKRPFSEAQLRRDYAAGMTQDEIAVKHGSTQKVVWLAMKRWGLQARVAAKRNQRGARNHSWKGRGASYKAFHQRLYVAKGKPRLCGVCGTSDPARTYDWANLTGDYSSMEDYKRMCRSCHWKYDNRIRNIAHMRRREDARG